MKNLLFQKAHQPFFVTAVITSGVAIFFWMVYRGSSFELSLYDYFISISQAKLWLFLSLYLFLLSGIYFVISRTKLEPKRWLVKLHYICIVLFLAFLVFFSSFSNKDVQGLIAGIPFTALITAYGIIFLVDVFFFLSGLILLAINILTLGKKSR